MVGLGGGGSRDHGFSMGHVDFEESLSEIIELHLGDLQERLHFVTHLCINVI